MESKARETDAMIGLTVRVGDEQSRKLKRWAHALGLSQGDVVRLLLNNWFDHHTSLLDGDKKLK